MSDLRVILALIGLVLMGGIYLHWVTAKRRRDRYDLDLSDEGIAPDLQPEDPIEDLDRLQDLRAAHNAGSLRDEHAPDSGLGAGADAPVVVSARRAGAAAEELPESFDIDALDGVAPEQAHSLPSIPAVPELEPPADDPPVDDPPVEDLIGLSAGQERPEQLDLSGLDLVAVDAPARVAAAARGQDSDDTDREELVVVVTVLARSGERLPGASVRRALEEAGLHYGERHLFHHYAAGQHLGAAPVFSALNVVKPGVFDLATMDSTATPGIALFLRLPGPEDPAGAFERMLATARRLAGQLGAHVCDESRSTLTNQAVNYIKEQLADYERRQLLRA